MQELTSANQSLPQPTYRTYIPEECPFETVIVDITHRCNMACSNCYIPNRTIPDLDASWLSTVLARLPRGTFVRLVGAEPTMRDDLAQIIRDIRRHGHHPVLLTNGLKLADRAYVKELKKAGLRVAYLSMNGALDDDLYEAIDSMRCAERKRAAFENLRTEHLFTSVGMIVVRGVNDHAVEALFRLVRDARNVRELKLRSIGAIGRYMRSAPLTLDELLAVFLAVAGTSADLLDRRVRTTTSHDFRFGRLRVQLTEWPDLDSPTRGRLTPEGTIAPFFEHVLENEGGY